MSAAARTPQGPRRILVLGAGGATGPVLVRELLSAGHDVTAGARNPSGLPEFVPTSTSDATAGRLSVVPVNSSDSTTPSCRAPRDPDQGNVLVNSAGVVGPRGPLPEITADDVHDILDANLLGVVPVTRAFLPLLRMSRNPRIVNVSSGTGRLTWQTERGWPQELAPPIYSMSKAAPTMLTLEYAQSLPDISVNAAWPGYTATDLNDHEGTQTVAEGAEPIVRLATLPPAGPTGTCQERARTADPW